MAEHGFVARIRSTAATLGRRVAFVEYGDERVRAAVHHIAASKMAHPVIVHSGLSAGVDGGLSALTQVDIRDADAAKNASDFVAERLRSKGRDEETVLRATRSPLYVANAMLALGDVDGVVAGAVHTTSDVLRAALSIVGMAPGISAVSGAFYMEANPSLAGTDVLTFADCAVIPEPTSSQLAGIAISAARDRIRIVGDEPVVALLSFSTHGSAAGASVDRVREAVELIRSAEPWITVDGDLQSDAALDRDICIRKAPHSPVMGRANVLIFPSLDAGNIAYKLVQRLGGGGAVGPILQGLLLPSNDLSRGSAESDIINVAAITALQSASASVG